MPVISNFFPVLKSKNKTAAPRRHSLGELVGIYEATCVFRDHRDYLDRKLREVDGLKAFKKPSPVEPRSEHKQRRSAFHKWNT